MTTKNIIKKLLVTPEFLVDLCKCVTHDGNRIINVKWGLPADTRLVSSILDNNNRIVLFVESSEFKDDNHDTLSAPTLSVDLQ